MYQVLNYVLGIFTGTVLPAVLTAVVGFLAIQLILKLLKTAFGKSKIEPAFSKLLVKVAAPVLYVLLGLIVATGLGIDVTSVVALASVLTLAISLSLQNALSNIFGGFTLLNTKPFVAEDYVEIAGQAGTVKEIGLAYTRLATPDNKLIFIPNSAVVAAEIVNYTATGTRRLCFDVSVDYNAKADDVVAALLEAGAVSKALSDPAPFAAMSGYGEGTALYTLRVWTATDDYWDAHFEINQRIKAVFAARGIAMSCSHLAIRVSK